MTPGGVLGKEQRKADFFPVQGLQGGKVSETTQTGVCFDGVPPWDGLSTDASVLPSEANAGSSGWAAQSAEKAEIRVTR